MTIGALLGMAAHLESKGCSVLDMTGLAQKNGAVVSHVRIGDTPEKLYATRIAAGEASLVLACDILTSVGNEALAKMQKGVTKALVNTALVMPAQFTREPDLKFPLGSMEQEIKDAVGPGDAEFLDATKLATALMGDSIATNLFMVGYAYQRGLIPVSEAAIMKAIELNGAAVESNKLALPLGTPCRRRSGEGRRCGDAGARPSPNRSACRESLDEMIARRVKFLTDYQDAAYAERYCDARGEGARGRSARDAGHHRAHRSGRALLLQAPRDQGRVRSRAPVRRDRFRASASPRSSRATTSSTFHLAPPIFNKPDPVTGVPKKSAYGPWMMKAFGVLAKMRKYRGTALDIFGRTEERRMERALIGEYEKLVDEILAQAHAAESRDGRRARVGPRAHPRLRPREGRAPQDGEDARGGAARGVPRAAARRRSRAVVKVAA